MGGVEIPRKKELLRRRRDRGPRRRCPPGLVLRQEESHSAMEWSSRRPWGWGVFRRLPNSPLDRPGPTPCRSTPFRPPPMGGPRKIGAAGGKESFLRANHSRKHSPETSAVGERGQAGPLKFALLKTCENKEKAHEVSPPQSGCPSPRRTFSASSIAASEAGTSGGRALPISTPILPMSCFAAER